jgi:hypothetical protein
MTKYCWILCFLLFLSLNGISQAPDYFPAIDETDLPDAKFEVPRTYNGASLYGYIDGGADLYLEYGFSGAWINEVYLMGGKQIIEIYRMNSPEDAFGIYSVSRFHCNGTPPLSPFTCQAPYQLQIVSGSFYINIINRTNNSTDSAASLKIGQAIVRKIKEKPADISVFLPDVPVETLNREALLVKGELGIRNGAPDLVNYFGEATGYSAVILQHTGESILSIKFSTKEALDAFESHHTRNPETLSTESETLPPEETITKISDNHLLIKIRYN